MGFILSSALIILVLFYAAYGYLLLIEFLTNRPWLYLVFTLSRIIIPSWLWYLLTVNYQGDGVIVGFFIFLPIIAFGLAGIINFSKILKYN